LAFSLVKEGKILGGKCIYDLAARWVNVVINLRLGRLCVFAHSGAEVLPKGKYISKEAAVWVWVVRVKIWLLYFGKDGIIKGSLLFCSVFFFYDVVYDDSSHIVIVVEIDWEPVLSELK
jgi:hypothetical protein